MYLFLSKIDSVIMSTLLPAHLSELPVYQKALEIFILSRSISSYLNQDLSHLKPDGSEDEHIYFSGDIVQQSVSLAPEIINVELERCAVKKQKHIASLERLTNALYRNCYRLEKSRSNGKDYLPVLRKELRKFRAIKNHWMLTL
ncbi:hypothetical protein SAMN04487990_101182 [Bizionia paragorgiae]|uniref:Uncharacterized protein n=2 Tax=Bizionia paragorgiae TaxID=283786 RepID=A0A1H3VHZ9_BIZPA|nr:hypothetical protein SAMN04487990_101182 [Bizionia paragorgiae]